MRYLCDKLFKNLLVFEVDFIKFYSSHQVMSWWYTWVLMAFLPRLTVVDAPTASLENSRITSQFPAGSDWISASSPLIGLLAETFRLMDVKGCKSSSL